MLYVQHEMLHDNTTTTEQTTSVIFWDNGVYYSPVVANGADKEYRFIPWSHLCGIVGEKPFDLEGVQHESEAGTTRFQLELTEQ